MYRTTEVKNGVVWDCLTVLKPTGTFKTATEKEVFDLCIKQDIVNGGPILPGRIVTDQSEANFGFFLPKYKRYYDRYLSSSLQLENSLSQKIRDSYEKGKGNEFSTGKFYSIASSSRFVVSCFSKPNGDGLLLPLETVMVNGNLEKAEIEFEVGLPIAGIQKNLNPPQMDASIRTESGNIYFIEGKCHEILDLNKNKEIRLKWKYVDSSAFRRFPLDHAKIEKKSVNTKTGTEEFISIDGRHLSPKDFGCDLKTHHIDVKQFLCHLMGIDSYQRDNVKASVHFYYVFYFNSSYLLVGNKHLYSELQIELMVLFGKFSTIFPNIDFGFLYNDRFDTIKDLKKRT